MKRLNNLDLADMRAAVGDLLPFGFDIEPVASVTDVRIDVGDDRSIRGRVLVPEGPARGPILLWLHGGSFVRAGLDSHEAFWRRFVNRARCVVVGLEYSLAPEHQYPIALDEAYAAMQWAQQASKELGGDGRIALAGDSRRN
jgi:acetyl esterase